jgi:hypothetical protein
VAADVQVTRGEGGSKSWSDSGLHSSSGEVLGTGGSEEQETRGVPEEEEGRRGGLRDSFAKPENLGTSW